VLCRKFLKSLVVVILSRVGVAALISLENFMSTEAWLSLIRVYLVLIVGTIVTEIVVLGNIRVHLLIQVELIMQNLLELGLELMSFLSSDFLGFLQGLDASADAVNCFSCLHLLV